MGFCFGVGDGVVEMAFSTFAVIVSRGCVTFRELGIKNALSGGGRMLAARATPSEQSPFERHQNRGSFKSPRFRRRPDEDLFFFTRG